MAIEKIIKDNELYLYMNGNLIYKRWLNTGNSKVFDVMAYDKYTLTSLIDMIDDGNISVKVKAKISLLRTEDGGRQSGIGSGYRPNHLFDNNIKNGQYNSFMGQIILGDQIKLYPGEEREAIVWFIASAEMDKYLTIGQKWWLYEGPRWIGNGEIIDFINSVNINLNQ